MYPRTEAQARAVADLLAQGWGGALIRDHLGLSPNSYCRRLDLLAAFAVRAILDRRRPDPVGARPAGVHSPIVHDRPHRLTR